MRQQNKKKLKRRLKGLAKGYADGRHCPQYKVNAANGGREGLLGGGGHQRPPATRPYIPATGEAIQPNHIYPKIGGGKDMNTKAKHRILSFALALCLVLGMTLVVPGPVEVYAANIGTADDLPVDTSGTTLVYFGHNYMKNATWNNGDTGYADNTHAPIAWRVVYDNNDGTLTLLSDELLATRPYDSGDFHNRWSDSEIAGYLNEDFLDESFDRRERMSMISEYSNTEESGYNDTDKFTPNQTIVLPSVAEVKDNGIWEMDNDRASMGEEWWLRSPGMDSVFAAMVNNLGSVDPSGGEANFSVQDPRGIRPAFRLNLSSVIFTSDASGASAKPATVGSTLTSAAKPQTGAVKLTLADNENLYINSTDTASRTVREGDTVSITYSGASAGANQYVSCVIVDTSGDVLYYGKLDDRSEGTASFEVPAGIGNGSYIIRLFNEECNGDKETDYASTPNDISMQVLGSGSGANLSVTAPTFTNETVGYLQPAPQPITIENTGNVDAAIIGVTLSGTHSGDFEIVEGDSTVVANDGTNGKNTTWKVRPNANLAAGTYTADIEVTYENGSALSASATVSFEVVATTNLSVNNIDFYTEQENYAQPAAKPIEITNNGLADASVTGITLAGSNTNDFELTSGDGTPFTVNSGGSNDTWSVQPKVNLAPGTYTTSIEVEYTGGPNPTDTATATVEFEVEPAVIPGTASLSVQGHDFGTLSLGYSQPAPEPITVTNNGDVDGTITNVTLSGNNSGAFLLDDAAPGDNSVTGNGGTNRTWTVQPAAGLPEGTYTATVTVTYTGGPNTSDTASATVHFKVEDCGGNPNPGQPHLTASPTQLDFGNVEVGESAERTVTVAGENLARDITYTISGSGSGAFSVSSGSGWSDAGGGVLEIAFRPGAEQTYNATLTLQSGGAPNVTVSLSGAGIQDDDGGSGNTGGGSTTRSSSVTAPAATAAPLTAR